MISNEQSETFICQRVMATFLVRGVGSFESFLASWEEAEGSKVHAITSVNPEVFGPYQAAIATFLGYAGRQNSEIMNRGSIYGVYLVVKTAPYSNIQPALISPVLFDELRPTLETVSDCRAIWSHLFKINAFVFVEQPYIIHTPYPEAPSRNVAKFSTKFSRTKECKAPQMQNISFYIYSRLQGSLFSS